jgi:hypothetical protein
MWRMAVLGMLCVGLTACGGDEKPSGDGTHETGGSGGSGAMAGSGGSGAVPQGGSGGLAPVCAVDPGASSPEVLDQEAPGTLGLYGVAIHETGLYWSKDGEGIKRLRPGATTSELVVPMERGAPVLSSSHVYFSKNYEVWRAALDPIPGAAALVAPLGSNSIFVVEEPTLYARDTDGMRIVQVSTAGGTPTTFVEPAQPMAMLLHGGFLYYSDFTTNRVQRVPVAGGSPTPVSPAANLQPNGIATDGTTLFWIDLQVLKRTPLSDPTQEVELGEARGDTLVLLDGRVYFEYRDGGVGWIAVDGTSCGTVAMGSIISNSGWAVDQQFVYVVSTGGDVLQRFHHQ